MQQGLGQQVLTIHQVQDFGVLPGLEKIAADLDMIKIRLEFLGGVVVFGRVKEG